jgi:hypothetical protein
LRDLDVFRVSLRVWDALLETIVGLLLVWLLLLKMLILKVEAVLFVVVCC